MRAAAATMRTALADGWANRASFSLQALFMIVNDVTWIAFWGFFFHRVGTIRGWTLGDVFVMFATVLVAAGFALGLFSNCRRIGQLAADGALDETLVLPVPPLPSILVRRLDAAPVGDLVMGIIVFAVAGDPTPRRTAIFVLAALAGAIVLTSFLVICSSLTFFVGGRGEQADLGLNAVVMFASYPIDLFGGATKVLLFTIVPAAFVTGVPSSLVRHFDPAAAMLLGAVAVGMAAGAWGLFSLGLRQYCSGSAWQR